MHTLSTRHTYGSIPRSVLHAEAGSCTCRAAETAVPDDERIERAISVAGQFRSGGGDGAAQHDLYLQGAYRR